MAMIRSEPARRAAVEWHPRDRFLAMLAHDLQTPMTAIILTAVELGRADDPRQRAAAVRVLHCAERMKRMTADLLDFARTPVLGALPVRPRSVDLAKLAADAVREVETSRPGSRVRLEPQGDMRGEWDPARMTQVIVNLVSNAVQHGAHGAPVDVRLVRHPDSMWIEVVNQGELIPDFEVPCLFKPFARGPMSRSGRESVGLGLFIVAEIVAAHEGEVLVFNSPETATVTFRVRLPLRSAARE